MEENQDKKHKNDPMETTATPISTWQNNKASHQPGPVSSDVQGGLVLVKINYGFG